MLIMGLQKHSSNNFPLIKFYFIFEIKLFQFQTSEMVILYFNSTSISFIGNTF